MKKLLIVVNVDWFFISHRLCIAEEAIKDSWDVYAIAGDTGRSEEILKTGVKYTPLALSRSGTNFFQEMYAIKKLYKLYKEIKPDVVHHVALKPIVYGSIISKILKIKGALNSFSGLGYVFTDDRKGMAQNIMVKMMRFGFNRKNLLVIFQNNDDYNELKKHKIFSKQNGIIFIKGSGVDLETYSEMPFPNNERVNILFPARMLWDKGILELKKATEILKEEYQDKVTFILAGNVDLGNKAGAPESYLKEWEHKNYVTWIDYQKDMIGVYANSDIVVLPSYREGMPKSLIEACAIGRPIITTNTVGCKECVDHGKNGLLVALKSGEDLANKLKELIDNQDLRITMGKASRKKAEQEFGLKNVIDKHLKLYNDFLSS